MPERHELRLLVVEDDLAMRRLIEAVLRAEGFARLATAETGAEAIARAPEADVILLDHKLPDLDGVGVIARLRELPHAPSVIVVTAHGNERLAAEALRAGAEDYLTKDGALAALLPQVVERVRRARGLREKLGAAEAELVRAERLAAIGEMTVTLHHEINNPLMAAFTEVQLLGFEAAAFTPEQRASLQRVQEALARIRDIVRRTGDLRGATARAYPGGMQMIELGASGARTPGSRGGAVVLLGEEQLGRVVDLLLREAGFRVARTADPAEARVLAGAADVTLVVVRSAADRPLGGLAVPAARPWRLVALGGDAAARAAGADALVPLPFDPETFAEELGA